MQASEEVLAQGNPYAALNGYEVGGGCVVSTVQIDELVHVVGQDDYSIGEYSLDEWLGQSEQTQVPLIQQESVQEALVSLERLRQGCLAWQCGACDAWIFTREHMRAGVLACSTCGRGGVDFGHADRHVGGES